jgi:hypothetical protein
MCYVANVDIEFVLINSLTIMTPRMVTWSVSASLSLLPMVSLVAVFRGWGELRAIWVRESKLDSDLISQSPLCHHSFQCCSLIVAQVTQIIIFHYLFFVNYLFGHMRNIFSTKLTLGQIYFLIIICTFPNCYSCPGSASQHIGLTHSCTFPLILLSFFERLLPFLCEKGAIFLVMYCLLVDRNGITALWVIT